MGADGAKFLSLVLPSLKNLKILRWQMIAKFVNLLQLKAACHKLLLYVSTVLILREKQKMKQ